MTQAIRAIDTDVSATDIDSLWHKYLTVAGDGAADWVTDKDIGCGFTVVQVPGSDLPHIFILDQSLLPKQAHVFLSAFWLQYAALLAEEEVTHG